MKTLRAVLLVIVYLNILFVIVSIFKAHWHLPKGREAYYICGALLGVIVMSIPAAVCFFFAARIKKRLEKQAAGRMLASLTR